MIKNTIESFTQLDFTRTFTFCGLYKLATIGFCLNKTINTRITRQHRSILTKIRQKSSNYQKFSTRTSISITATSPIDNYSLLV